MTHQRQTHHRELTLCEYNLENLFISMEYYAGEDLKAISEEGWKSLALAQLRQKQKPLFKIFGIAEAIQTINPDVLMLTEVGGQDSLVNLNRYFLNDQFDVFYVEGNSTRNIDLGFLVKKGIGYVIETRSNRDTPVEVRAYNGKYLTRFSRDVAELRLIQDGKLELMFLLVHLKSMLSTDHDHMGKDQRTAEANALVTIYENYRAQMPEVPIVVGGDFNTQLSSIELELLSRTDLTDFHDCLQTPQEERVSLIHFEVNGRPKPNILDYLLISPHLRDRVVKEKSYTFRYKSFYDIPEPLPDVPRQRYRLPSDHYPLVLTIRL